MPKFSKFSVSKPKIWPKTLVQEASFEIKISSASSIVVKKSVQQVPKFGADLFYRPHFWPFRPYTPYQNESRVPPRAFDSTQHTSKIQPCLIITPDV